MKENLQNALVEILNRAISGIDSSVAFMQAELPDVISQLLTWYAVKSATYSLFGILIIITYLVGWKMWIKRCENNSISPDVIELFAFPALLGMLPFLTAVCMIDLQWLQIWIAPKIWLMEYAAELVK